MSSAAAKVSRTVRARARGLDEIANKALTAETITNLNPLTPLPILRLFRPAGTLDALANCTALTRQLSVMCGKVSPSLGALGPTKSPT